MWMTVCWHCSVSLGTPVPRASSRRAKELSGFEERNLWPQRFQQKWRSAAEGASADAAARPTRGYYGHRASGPPHTPSAAAAGRVRGAGSGQGACEGPGALALPHVCTRRIIRLVTGLRQSPALLTCCSSPKTLRTIEGHGCPCGMAPVQTLTTRPGLVTTPTPVQPTIDAGTRDFHI